MQPRRAPRLAFQLLMLVLVPWHAPFALGQETFWVIPHTHWEGAVFKTREEYLEMGLANILKALRLLKTQPNYRFVLDQVAYVKPFLERYPEEETAFRQFVQEGRLELVLGMDIMPDVNVPGGESFVRQIQYGKGYYRQKLGVDVRTAWLVDTFGHHAQIPQLLKLGGYKTFWFSRGVPAPDHPSEFLWQGIDGSQIPAFWLPYSYGLLYGSPKNPAQFRDFVLRRFRMLEPNSRPRDRVGLSGADVSEPEDHLLPRVEEFNRLADRPFTLRLAVPSDFEKVVAQRTDRPVFKGELNPIFQGTYSSRIELKHWMRTLERLLSTAEKTSVIASWLGFSIDHAGLWRAWEPVLFNQTHDLASGVMTDHVYDDTLRSYRFSERLANELIENNWNAITAQVGTRGDGIPIVVMNTLAWARTDVADTNVAFADNETTGITVVDERGQEVPVQALEVTRYSDGKLKQARIAFIARDVPAMGYSVYHVIPKTTGMLQAPDAAERQTLENDFFQLALDPGTGAIQSLLFKPGQWQVFRAAANVVARQADHGDLWELYRGLDGGSKIAMTKKQPVPLPGQAVLSSEFQGRRGQVRSGPVVQEFNVSHPLGNGAFATSIRMYTGMRRIDLTTTLVNNERFVRYQALFPTTISSGRNTQAIPFGASERPLGIEFPAQEWVDYGDGRHGLGLLNLGLPGNLVTDGTMMLSLLRSHTLGAYGFGGGYEPGMSSDTGLQLGQERTLRYALFPHEGDWRQAGVFRAGLEFNNPLICRKVSRHAGRLPRRWSFLEVSHPEVVVSALQPGPAGTILVRAYEATGRPASKVKVKFASTVTGARGCNLMNDECGKYETTGNTLEFDIGPFEIKTFKLQLQPG
jgi:alpha-mannosidase